MLNTLLAIFANTLLPVFLVAGTGYVLSSRIKLETRTLGRFLFYLATPALVLRSLYSMELDLTALQHVAVVAVAILLASGLLGWLASAGLARRQRAALVITSAVSNNGNMGMPISLFALGPSGLALATVYYAITSVVGNTLGVVVASSGSQPWQRALLQSLRAPVLYAAATGLSFNLLNIAIPENLFRAVELLAGAAIPGMLVLLGAQLRETKLDRRQLVVWRSMGVRLLVAPLLAWGLCLLLGITGVERQVVTLQAAMPTAVITTVLATEFDAAPQTVAAAILASTVASMVTLSVVIALIA